MPTHRHQRHIPSIHSSATVTHVTAVFLLIQKPNKLTVPTMFFHQVSIPKKTKVISTVQILSSYVKYLFLKKSLDLWLLKGIQRVNNLPLSIYENISYIYKARGEWCSGDRVSEELGSAANLFALRMSNLPLHQTQSSADPFSRVVLSMSLSLSLHQFLPLCFLSSPPLGGFERRDLNKLQSQIKLQFGFKARSRLFRFSMQKIEIHSMH